MKTFQRVTLALLLIISLSSLSLAQPFKFGWITDLHIGAKNADVDLQAVVQDINLKKEISFVVATGDITESGKAEDLKNAKQILDNLSVPYYIIPGNHDTKWSESGGQVFSNLWKDDKFVFDYDKTILIGLSSGISWRGGGGHFSPEDLHWLDSLLSTIPSEKEILFFAHHQLDKEVDNWFRVTNLLAKKNVKEIFVGHGHANRVYNFNGLAGVMSRSTLTAKGKSWGYTLVDDQVDSLFFFEITKDTIYKRWNAVGKEEPLFYADVDSTDYENLTANVLWQKDLKTTMVAPVTTYEKKIIATAKNGVLYCFDEDGRQLWKTDLGASLFCKPAVANNIVIVGTMKGDLFTLDISNGHVIQVIGIDEAITSPIATMEIDYQGEKSFAAVFGTATGKIFSYELSSLNLLWNNTSAVGMIESKPLIQKDKIIFGSWDTFLYCIDATTGLLNWKWTGNPVFNYSPAASPLVTDGKNVFFATPDKAITAVDLLLGKTSWRKTDYDAWESIGISNDEKRIFVKSQNDKLHIISAANGKIQYTIDMKFGLDTGPIQPVEVNENIYFGSKNGNIYSIDPKYNFSSLFFMGTARTHSLQILDEQRIAASNMDGKIIVFKVN
ncbi:MAG: PQQ-binding-like beta-propeller repeat protein [Ignavibacteriaceae bacterium]|nr:PQQ-binding-like beta-propeller repeat protein [Ignavibacteriaceae bacterium]